MPINVPNNLPAIEELRKTADHHENTAAEIKKESEEYKKAAEEHKKAVEELRKTADEHKKLAEEHKSNHEQAVKRGRSTEEELSTKVGDLESQRKKLKAQLDDASLRSTEE